MTRKHLMPTEGPARKRLDLFRDVYLILTIVTVIVYSVFMVSMTRPLTVTDDKSLALDPGQNATLVDLHPDVDGSVSFKIAGVSDGIVNVTIVHDGQSSDRQYAGSSGSDSFRFSRDHDVLLAVENVGDETTTVNATTEVVFDHLFTTRDVVMFSLINVGLVIILLVAHRYNRKRFDSTQWAGGRRWR